MDHAVNRQREVSEATDGRGTLPWPCVTTHTSVSSSSRGKKMGCCIYNGPIVSPETEELLVSDFISVELDQGRPRLLIDFGSGTLELRVKTEKSLDDGEWHRIDIYWDTEVRLNV
ncbi:unnamed protein product, partial [Timema podura]|nr:unnamed protein product [Timema podura]